MRVGNNDDFNLRQLARLKLNPYFREIDDLSAHVVKVI